MAPLQANRRRQEMSGIEGEPDPTRPSDPMDFATKLLEHGSHGAGVAVTDHAP